MVMYGEGFELWKLQGEITLIGGVLHESLFDFDQERELHVQFDFTESNINKLEFFKLWQEYF